MSLRAVRAERRTTVGRSEAEAQAKQSPN